MIVAQEFTNGARGAITMCVMLLVLIGVAIWWLRR